MPEHATWTILGNNSIAGELRSAAAYVDAPAPITIATEPGEIPADAIAIGPAILYSVVEQIVPFYSAFEAVEEVKRVLEAGETGRVYGCFISFRIARGATGDEVTFNALLPALAVTLDLFTQPVARVHARRASLLAADDAWFVTLRFADEVIATIEAMAVRDPAAGLPRELLVEVTASERVLRAEPMRQAVIVEPVRGVPVAHAWWEELPERFLKLVSSRASQPHDNGGSRLRAVWAAIQDSDTTGEAIVDPLGRIAH